MADNVFDLDALRAARADGKRDRTLHVDGKDYTIPAKLPLYVALMFGQDKILDGLKLLLGDEAFDEIIVKGGFDLDDMNDMFSKVYGVGAGESQASGD